MRATGHGIRVAAHAHGTEGIKAAGRVGVTSIEHGSMLDDEAIAMIKAHGTYLIPTWYLIDLIASSRGSVAGGRWSGDRSGRPAPNPVRLRGSKDVPFLH